MKKHFVTFGQEHIHRVGGKVFDKDCVAQLNILEHVDGRGVAFELFGAAFCFEYSHDRFDFGSMKYFPRGFVEIDL